MHVGACCNGKMTRRIRQPLERNPHHWQGPGRCSSRPVAPRPSSCYAGGPPRLRRLRVAGATVRAVLLLTRARATEPSPPAHGPGAAASRVGSCRPDSRTVRLPATLVCAGDVQQAVAHRARRAHGRGRRPGATGTCRGCLGAFGGDRANGDRHPATGCGPPVAASRSRSSGKRVDRSQGAETATRIVVPGSPQSLALGKQAGQHLGAERGNAGRPAASAAVGSSRRGHCGLPRKADASTPGVAPVVLRARHRDAVPGNDRAASGRWTARPRSIRLSATGPRRVSTAPPTSPSPPRAIPVSRSWRR